MKPDHDLNIMKHGQTLHSITCDILERLTPVLDQKPDMILVHGDTTTTFAAALAAFYQQIAIGHVGSGRVLTIAIPPSPRRSTDSSSPA
ncbi:MAG: UDP-N-acetylglucosamine 2-epimerase [Merdibacter sp.]